MVIYANNSPLAGQDGTKLTSQLIRERLYKEAETNVALQVLPGPTSESLELRGRGVLHLGILLETLRREGFEVGIGSPQAVLIEDPTPRQPGDARKRWLEPIEECIILVPEEYAGTVVQKLTMRKGEMVSYEQAESGIIKIVMDVPARGLIGYMAGEFKNDVHGQGYVNLLFCSPWNFLTQPDIRTRCRTLNHIFKAYMPHKGSLDASRNGALISMADGITSGYAMAPLQARGVMFIHKQSQGVCGVLPVPALTWMHTYRPTNSPH